MSNSEELRLAIVADLLAMNGSLDELVRMLEVFTWDYAGEGVRLTRRHLIRALMRYVKEDASADEIETWANHIEGRDDVLIDGEQVIGSVLHELANPSLTHTLTSARARQLLGLLSGQE